MIFDADLKNLTAHDITVEMADSDESFTIAPSGIIARCQTEYTTVAQVVAGGDQFNIRERYFNEPQDLPDPVEGTLYIVSRIVAEACADSRDDLLMVDGTIRDENGRIIGCEAFARWPNTPQDEKKPNHETWWGKDAERILDYIEMYRGNMSAFEVLEDIMCGSYVDSFADHSQCSPLECKDAPKEGDE